MIQYKVLTADWCVACRTLKTILPEFEKKYNIKFEIVPNSDLYDLPVLLVVEEGKEKAWLHLHGYISERAIDDFLRVLA